PAARAAPRARRRDRGAWPPRLGLHRRRAPGARRRGARVPPAPPATARPPAPTGTRPGRRPPRSTPRPTRAASASPPPASHRPLLCPVIVCFVVHEPLGDLRFPGADVVERRSPAPDRARRGETA